MQHNKSDRPSSLGKLWTAWGRLHMRCMPYKFKPRRLLNLDSDPHIGKTDGFTACSEWPKYLFHSRHPIEMTETSALYF